MSTKKTAPTNMEQLGVVMTAHPVAGVQFVANGQPVELAVLTDQGVVLAQGQEVADFFAQACISSYHRSLRNTGRIRAVPDSST